MASINTTTAMTLEDFPLKAFDKVRYADTDRQGHVNNAVFSTFLETGRVELLLNPEAPLLLPGASFVIAKLELQLQGEIHWPGVVDIGTVVTKVGNSSVTLYQQIYQKEWCVAEAETVIVQMNEETRRSQALGEQGRQVLKQFSIK